jgi:hypothetical protein
MTDRDIPDAGSPVPADQVARWKAAVAAHNAAKRRRRLKRPGPQVTGVRIPPPEPPVPPDEEPPETASPAPP